MIIFASVNFDDLTGILMVINANIHIDCIIVTGGWCNVGTGVSNLIDILDWIGVDIPVFPGTLSMLNQESVFLSSLYTGDTLWNIMRHVPRSKKCLPPYNNDYIEFCKKINRPVDLLMLSSFTDVVPLLSIIDVRNVYTFGHRVDIVSDTKFSDAESNTYLDPIAARRCLNVLRDKIHWIPAPFMDYVSVDKHLVDRIKNKCNRKTTFLIYKLLSNLIKTGDNELVKLWDSILALAAIDSSIFEYSLIKLSIDDQMSINIDRTIDRVIVIKKYSTSLGVITEDDGILTNVLTSTITPDQMIDQVLKYI